jgi:hypothetical protein
MWDGLPKPNFHVFMVAFASVNYIAICKLYGGDPNVPLENKECTSFYHWEENLQI